MSNILYLWLLLLLIPIVAFDLCLHFFIAKKIAAPHRKKIFHICGTVWLILISILWIVLVVYVLSGVTVSFSYKWLLLLLIPAAVLTLIPYFRLSKRYRKNRNRITSITLHLIIMVLCIAVFAGATFDYKIYNHENEIILLVDVSESQEVSAVQMDRFVETVLHAAKFDAYKVGVVLFAFGQVNVIPLTSEIDGIFDRYLDAVNAISANNTPDISATNIASALTYASTLFNYPDSGKIVLISDGKETDEQASTVIRYIAALGIRVDVTVVPSDFNGQDVQIVGAKLPDYHVVAGEECVVSAILKSNASSIAIVEMYDNGMLTGRKRVEIVEGENIIDFTHTFTINGFHEIVFKISANTDDLSEEEQFSDSIERNNQYHVCFLLEVFDKILILESNVGESEKLVALLTADNIFQIDVMNVYTGNEIPKSVDALRAYDQIILNNISNANLINSNMPPLFPEMLYAYVNTYGGGLLTVGGNDASGNANAYNRVDLRNTLYQHMLPVQAIDYKPPLGVMVVVDRSGSMGDADGNGVTNLEWARAGAVSCLDALQERDWFGLITFNELAELVLPLTPRTQEEKILVGLNNIGEPYSGTVFTPAIERAGMELRQLKNVDRRHIIIISDGKPSDSRNDYEPVIRNFYETDGITFSNIVIGTTKDDSPYDENTPLEVLDGLERLNLYETMLRTVIIGSGRIYATLKASDLVDILRRDLEAPDIKEINYEYFYPTVNNASSPLLRGVATGEGENRYNLTVGIDGFYGVRIKTNTELILTGKYDVPIYAQWKFGKGMIGSFMFDLNKVWSSDFMSDSNGQRFIFNVINNLMPIESIRSSEISATLTEYNYINQLSVFSRLEEGQYMQGRIVDPLTDQVIVSLDLVGDAESDIYTTVALSAANNYSRTSFVIKPSGVYKIILTKYDKNGTVIATHEIYKAFSYSKEYDMFSDKWNAEELESYLLNLAAKGGGKIIANLDDPYEVFEGFALSFDRSFDPRFLFSIIAILLFLLDIVVRKFKFKWPWELVREYKVKKAWKQ